MATQSQFDVEALEPRLLLSGEGFQVPSEDIIGSLASFEVPFTQSWDPSEETLSPGQEIPSRGSGLLDSGEEFFANLVELAQPAACESTARPDESTPMPAPGGPIAMPVGNAGLICSEAGLTASASPHQSAAVPGADSGRKATNPLPELGAESPLSFLVMTLRAPNGPPEHPALSSAAATEASTGVVRETVNSASHTVGIENIANAEAWSATEEYVWDVGSVIGTEGLSWDLINVTGNPGTLTLVATKTQEFLLSLHAAGPLIGFQNNRDYSWRILHTSGGILDFDRSDIVVDPSGIVSAGNNLGGGHFVVDLSADGLDLLLRFLPADANAIQLTEPLTWKEEGPYKVTGNSNTIIPPDDPVVGAVNSIAIQPGKPSTAYLAAVGGGIWKSVNFTNAVPTWEPIEGQLPILAVSAIAVSPTDRHGDLVINSTPDGDLVLYAGLGSTSSSGQGPNSQGLFRSEDGGRIWQQVGPFQGLIVQRILPSQVEDGPVWVVAIDPTQRGVALQEMAGSFAPTTVPLGTKSPAREPFHWVTRPTSFRIPSTPTGST